MISVIKSIVTSNAFWTIIGIMVAGLLNYFLWRLQWKAQKKEKDRLMKLEKIEQISDFFETYLRTLSSIISSVEKMSSSQYVRKSENVVPGNGLLRIYSITTLLFPQSETHFSHVMRLENQFKEEHRETLKRGDQKVDKLLKIIKEIADSQEKLFNVIYDEIDPEWNQKIQKEKNEEKVKK